ncbi:D-3-phosphoglycerate dehydrogenase-like [Ptychodera flava]|uniref:D-3-phosphoglycerate dehydrogenase-like n=1 Tax=Ptychodera flava TaxID=63121 RepID=UPI00396A5DCB
MYGYIPRVQPTLRSFVGNFRAVNIAANMAFQLKRVLISDSLDPCCAKILEENGIAVDTKTKLSKEELVAEISNYDGIVVRSATKVTAEVIAASKNLRIIGRAGTGVDNIDIGAASKKGIIVMNTPAGNTLSAAEHTCAMICAMSRNIPQAHMSMKSGKWDRKSFMGSELYGKTLAIVGLGRIGREVALRMQSFGMTTIGFDPLVPPEVSATFNTEWLEVKDIWPRADYITVHTPLIPQTKGLLNDESFQQCKKGVRVLNIARGGIIDEEALLRALNSGQCAGAALDVFVEEPPTNRDLVDHPHLIATPHLGASTTEAQKRVAEEIAEQFVDLVKGKRLEGGVNAMALSNALSPDTRPVVSLGQGLGAVAAALAGEVNAKTKVQINTYGTDLESAGSFLPAAVAVGVLKAQVANSLNLVSAPFYAKELGIKITCQHSNEGLANCKTGVTLTLDNNGAIHKVTGTVQGTGPLLVDVGGATFMGGVLLSGNVLLYKGGQLSAITGALAGSSQVLSYSSTEGSDGWSAMHLAQPLASLDAIKSHASQINQISL